MNRGLFRNNPERVIAQPLANQTPDELDADVRNFHVDHELGTVVDVRMLIKGARIARDRWSLSDTAVPGITSAELNAIDEEKRLGLFQQTKGLKVTVLTMACAAIIQGWQQSTINASSSNWQKEFGFGLDTKYKPLKESINGFIDAVPGFTNNKLLAGFIDAAPWLSGSLIGTWLSDPLQERVFGRRPALFVAAIFCVVCVIGCAECNNWKQLLACRVLLGIGIGAKASIAPLLVAEAAVDHLRGRLLMMWQLFDAFGMFLGFACALIVRESWRVLVATAMIPAVVLLVLVFICPESPRFLIRKNLYVQAYKSLRDLRGTEIQAARDLYYIHSQLEEELKVWEEEQSQEHKRYPEAFKALFFWQRVVYLVTIPLNRRACLSAFLAMASQQLCGINVLAFYSSSLFHNLSGRRLNQGPSLSDKRTAWYNFGFGLASFIFTLPAYRFIDARGRRVLLLISLCGMFFSLLAVGLCFKIDKDDVRVGLVVLLTIGAFTFFYSLGAGPVPFTLSAEVFPLAFREVGMSFSVMINFLGLGLLVLFVPPLTEAFDSHKDSIDSRDGQTNLLLMFTGLNAVAFILVFLLVRSTKGRNLEEMNYIFRVKTSQHVQFQVQRMLPWLYKRYILRQHEEKQPDFMEMQELSVNRFMSDARTANGFVR